MSKHTPGPWQAINWTYHSTSTVVVDDPSVVTGKRVIAECATEEDASLIAAAPKLLNALRDLLRFAELHGVVKTMQGDEIALPVISDARAAVAKAGAST